MATTQSTQTIDITDTVDLSVDPGKRGRGRPKKTDTASQRTWADIEELITETVTRSLAPLVESLQVALNSKVESLHREFRKFVDNIEITIMQQINQALQQVNGEDSTNRLVQQDRLRTSPADSPPVDLPETTPATKLPKQPTRVTHSRSAGLVYDKKFKFIVYGIEESPKGTSRGLQNRHDLDKVSTIISNLESTITSQSVRDCGRLGRYNEQRSRPVIVHLNKADDVTTIISKRGSLAKPIVIKPYMSPEERIDEAVLMKQRWTLIESGVDRKRIKIRNTRLYVDRKLHGKVANSQYQLSTTDTSLDSESDATATIYTLSSDPTSVDATTEVTVPSDR